MKLQYGTLGPLMVRLHINLQIIPSECVFGSLDHKSNNSFQS